MGFLGTSELTWDSVMKWKDTCSGGKLQIKSDLLCSPR